MSARLIPADRITLFGSVSFGAGVRVQGSGFQGIGFSHGFTEPLDRQILALGVVLYYTEQRSAVAGVSS